MTNEDKQLICEYMGWTYHVTDDGKWWNCIGPKGGNHLLDLNDAGVCVQEMQKRGDWNRFLNHGFNSLIDVYGFMAHNFIATLFRAENFFGAMAAWLKEGKK